jgi:hypothetical protein
MSISSLAVVASSAKLKVKVKSRNNGSEHSATSVSLGGVETDVAVY